MYCDGTWDISGTLHATEYDKPHDGKSEGFPKEAMKVNSKTCVPLEENVSLGEKYDKFKEKYNMTNQEFFAY